MSLVFENAAPPAVPQLQRADVACFIGFVQRRPNRPLPDAVRRQLRAGGWTEGLWRRPPSQIDSLENLPVVIDSWQLFDALFAWDARPVRSDEQAAGAGPRATCATYLGAAVRSFFARGGQRAVVIRAGDPWPCLDGAERRAALLRERLRRLLPDYAEQGAPARPFQPQDPSTWVGIHHLYGLRGVSMLVLPDLADACSAGPPRPETRVEAALPPEGFVECSEQEPSEPADRGLRHIPAPRLDSQGYAAWQLAVSAAHGFLADRRNGGEVLLVAALPLPDVSANRTQAAGGRVHAQADLLAYLRRIGVLAADGQLAQGSSTSSAFIQLAWPWLRTAAAQDLPEGLEPADAVLAGLIAAGALRRGTFRSVAGEGSMPLLRDVGDAEPVPAWSTDEANPTSRLARHVCVFAPQPGGWALQSDVTTAPDEAWRFGGASRLMSTVLRLARAAGDALVFDVNGPASWSALRNTIEDVLMGFWREGAFAGASASEAFSVRCDASTMSRNDLDNGRLVAEITLRPAVSIERITVVLKLGNSLGAGTLRQAA